MNDRSQNEAEARRLRRDEKTLWAMARIYCASNCEAEKDERGLCPECAACIEYAIERTRRCPHEHKGNCEDCDIHCYQPEKRAQIRAIMAFAGPRMLTKHPVMALRYLKKKFARKRGSIRS